VVHRHAVGDRDRRERHGHTLPRRDAQARCGVRSRPSGIGSTSTHTCISC
jgi:hypothetical protein